MPSEPPLMTIDPARCSQCGACILVCFQQLWESRTEGPPAWVTDRQENCMRCGHCLAACPSQALRHGELPADGFLKPERFLDFENLLDQFGSRRSVRHFCVEVPKPELLDRLWRVAASAPTGHNAREVQLTVWTGRAGVQALQERLVNFYRRLFRWVENPFTRQLVRLKVGRAGVAELREVLPEMQAVEVRLQRGEDPLFHAAPVLALFHGPARAETAELDCAFAAHQVALAAPSLGLGTCYIGYASAALKKVPALARAAAIPPGRLAYVALVVGHPLDSFAWQIQRTPLKIHSHRVK